MKILAVLKQNKILGNVYFSEQIFYRKQSLGAPVLSSLFTVPLNRRTRVKSIFERPQRRNDFPPANRITPLSNYPAEN